MIRTRGLLFISVVVLAFSIVYPILAGQMDRIANEVGDMQQGLNTGSQGYERETGVNIDSAQEMEIKDDSKNDGKDVAGSSHPYSEHRENLNTPAPVREAPLDGQDKPTGDNEIEMMELNRLTNSRQQGTGHTSNIIKSSNQSRNRIINNIGK